MVRRFTTIVASSGTSNVARYTPNTTFRPGKSSIAKAYAASSDVTTMPAVTANATIGRVEQVPVEVAPVQAARSTSNVNASGSSGLCSTRLPGFNDAITVVYTGNSTTNTIAASST